MHCKYTVQVRCAFLRTLSGVAGTQYRLCVLRELHRARAVYTEEALIVTLRICTTLFTCTINSYSLLMRTEILCTYSVNAKCFYRGQSSGALYSVSSLTETPYTCSVLCEFTHRNTVSVQCILSDHAPVHIAPALYAARAH